MSIRRVGRWQLGVAVVAGAAALLVQPISGAAVGEDAVGDGTISSEMAFSPAVPPLVDTSPSLALDNRPVALSWSIIQDRGSVAAYVDDRGLFFAGGVTITGSGSSTGESITAGGGSFSVAVSGTNIFGGTLGCPNISGAGGGSYFRVGVLVEFAGGSGQGTCFVDGQPVPVSFQGVGLFQTDCSLSMGNPPSSLPAYNCNYGNGVDSAVSRIKFDGVWTIFSAPDA